MSVTIAASGATSTAATSAVRPTDASGTDAAKASGSAPVKDADAPSAQQQARSQLNASIVQASLAVSISSQNEPLTLLYKSAITSLNETLKPQFGDDAIQNAAGQDNTPEGTAGRIVSLSTGFFEQFKKQHVGEDEDVVLKKFMDTIQSGVEKGFKEARDILGSLNVLNGNIASNVDKTYELVQKGYADFEAAHSSAAKAPANGSAPAATK